MKILIGCEYSGLVRDAFTALGHDAMSCDLLDSERPGKHYKGSVLDVLDGGWDMAIFHPPCTFTATSGNRWLKDNPERAFKQKDAVRFVKLLLSADIPRIGLEQPMSVVSSQVRKADQMIQPWQFGHGEIKATCLWLKNLPRLRPTNIVDGRVPRVATLSPSADRWKERSRTFEGIALAMAAQWSNVQKDYPLNATLW